MATKLSETPKATATDTKKNITSAYIRLDAKLVVDDQQYLELDFDGALFCSGLWPASMDQPLRTSVGLARWHKIQCSHDRDSVDAAKWVDVRVAIDGRQLIVQSRGRRGKAFRGRWNVGYFTETQDLKRRHYVVTNELDRDDRAILRVPATSTCVAALDAMTR